MQCVNIYNIYSQEQESLLTTIFLRLHFAFFHLRILQVESELAAVWCWRGNKEIFYRYYVSLQSNVCIHLVSQHVKRELL